MITVDPSRSALLVMDFQADIVAMLGEKSAALIARTGGVVAAARRAQLPIVFVVVGFRPGYPEVSANNASFSAAVKSGRFIITTPGADIVAGVGREDGDVVVVKRRVGAFQGTDLEMVLRAKGVDTLLLAGISTSGVILSTVRHAADSDYRILVIKDCCADGDDDVHRVLTEKVLVRQATMTTATELTDALQAS